MRSDTMDEILEEMFHYAEHVVTGDNEKRIVKDFADRIKRAWNHEKLKRIMCAECGDSTSIDNLDEEGVCKFCREKDEE